MAKEAKTKTLTATFEYDGIPMTLSDGVKDYEIESATKEMANLIKVLAGSGSIPVN